MKHVKTFSALMLMVMFTLTISITSCKKDDDGPTPDPIPPSGSTLKTNVAGKVTNTDGDIMQGVTVTLAGKTTVTDHRGIYLFKNIDVPKDRMVLKARQTGYFDCIKGKKTQTRGVNYVDMVIQELPAVVNINATSGGTVNIPGGARIVFQPGSFVDQNGNPYTGTVKVYARHFNPAAPGFAAIVPGGDLIGKNILGENVALYPMGMIEALLRDQSGVNEIKIASGSTAQLRVPIDPSQNAMAQSTVPLWHLNETTGIWKEEGEAVKNGNFFEGDVSHFTVWNWDYQGPKTDIKGRVVDCQNNPVPGVVVTINGFMNLITDNAGEYTIWVPVGYTITAQVLAIYNQFLVTNSSQLSLVAVAGQLNIFPDISIQCPTTITGTTVSCGTTSPQPSVVIAEWNNSVSYTIAGTGSYTLLVPPNEFVVVTANSFSFTGSNLTGSDSVMSGNPGVNTILNPIELCPSTSINSITFTLTLGLNPPVNYQIIPMPDSTKATFYDTNNDGVMDLLRIKTEGTLVPGSYFSVLEFYLKASANGLLYSFSDPLNSAYLYIDGIFGGPISVFYNHHSAVSTNHQLIITNPGSPGSALTGAFSFDIGDSTSTVTNGLFSIIRTN
jgi:hypothetical protein